MNHLKTCKPHLTAEEYIAIIETDELAKDLGISGFSASELQVDDQCLCENPVVGPTLRNLSERVFGSLAIPIQSDSPGS